MRRRWVLFLCLIVLGGLAIGYVKLMTMRHEWANVDSGVVAFKRGDYSTAVKILTPYAEAGNSTARFNLGLAYAFGYGVGRDRSKARELLQDSTDRRTAETYLWIAQSFEKGDGIAADPNEASAWYAIAAHEGSDEARRLLSSREQADRPASRP